LQASIASNDSISETTRNALIQARRGQGRFKENVARFERECRITHVGNPTHLIASHIKPWRESSDEERLASGNGLLLTPSIDHLFDRGFISFGDGGEVLVSPVADTESLPRMGVVCDRPLFAGRFNTDQRYFLDSHRKEIFLKSAL
jgi:putative restriction endonuclease